MERTEWLIKLSLVGAIVPVAWALALLSGCMSADDSPPVGGNDNLDSIVATDSPGQAGGGASAGGGGDGVGNAQGGDGGASGTARQGAGATLYTVPNNTF